MKPIGDATRFYPNRPEDRAAQRLLAELAGFAFGSGHLSPLAKLCAAGVQYAWCELERTVEEHLLQQISAKARASLRSQLQGRLEQLTRPCFELEWNSFGLAIESLGLAPTSDRAIVERTFWGEQPTYRLVSLFKKFPVLPRLWLLAIEQWGDHAKEVLSRAAMDRPQISHLFFKDKPLGRIKDIQVGLSDPHHGGRSVTLVEFAAGRVVYKPRSGSSELEWLSLVTWMDEHGLQPGLRAARLLQREKYYWMESVEARPCQSTAAVRRFYQRLGATIAAVYLMKGVDCHRENIIAAGEFPILVDIDALWHVSALTKTQTRTEVLYRTGFFPSSRPDSLQSRSSVLGPGPIGAHGARLRGKAVSPSIYEVEILQGFSNAWSCLVGTSQRRAAFRRRVRRVQRQKRRWIYSATEKYAAILEASIHPSALGSAAGRARIIRRLCSRESVSKEVVNAEVNALRRLDLPYFVRKTAESVPAEPGTVPRELLQAIRKALLFAGTRVGDQR